jgi:hypothetical protein
MANRQAIFRLITSSAAKNMEKRNSGSLVKCVLPSRGLTSSSVSKDAISTVNASQPELKEESSCSGKNDFAEEDLSEFASAGLPNE